MKIIFIIFFMCFNKVGFSQVQQDSCELMEYLVQFWRYGTITEYVPVKDVKKNHHRILFESGFRNDTVQVFVNNKFHQEFILTSGFSSSNTFEYCDVVCKKQCRIKIIIGKQCLDFVFLDNYKVVSFSKIKDEWYLTFTNYYWFSE